MTETIYQEPCGTYAKWGVYVGKMKSHKVTQSYTWRVRSGVRWAQTEL